MIFFDSSKFDKDDALYFHSFSVPKAFGTSEDFASLFLQDMLSDYRQNKPFKYNTPPYLLLKNLCLRPVGMSFKPILLTFLQLLLMIRNGGKDSSSS
jgi:hypothetical protein